MSKPATERKGLPVKGHKGIVDMFQASEKACPMCGHWKFSCELVDTGYRWRVTCRTCGYELSFKVYVDKPSVEELV